MAVCEIFVWARARENEMDILDHALVRISLNDPTNASRYNCSAVASYTVNSALNIRAMPIVVSPANVDTWPNRQPLVSFVGQSPQGMRGFLGNESFSMRRIIPSKDIDVSGNEGNNEEYATKIIKMIDGSGAKSGNFRNVSNDYNNSIPPCLYIALRAAKMSHADALGRVENLFKGEKIRKLVPSINRFVDLGMLYDGGRIMQPLVDAGYIRMT